MEFLQKRSDIVMTFVTKGQKDVLQSGYPFRGNANQKRTAVVNSGEDA